MSIVDAIRPVLAATAAVRLAVVFGSEARGEASPGSDVDVALDGDLEALDLGVLGVESQRRAGRRIDLLALDAAPPLLRFQVARDGQVILEREPNAWADFRGGR